jgi:hypothetical protein
MPEQITLNRLPALLRPGMTVFVAGASGEPTPLLEALAAAPEASAGVHYVGCRIPGLNVIDPAAFHPDVGSRASSSSARSRGLMPRAGSASCRSTTAASGSISARSPSTSR